MAQPNEKALLQEIKDLSIDLMYMEKELEELKDAKKDLKITEEFLQESEADVIRMREELKEKEEKIGQLADDVVEANDDYLTAKRQLSKMKGMVTLYERKLTRLGLASDPDLPVPKFKSETKKGKAPKQEFYLGEPEGLRTVRENCKTLADRLNEKVKGQDPATGMLKRALRGHFSPLSEKRPTCFLFTGPTGVGKTYTAEVLNEVLFEGMDIQPKLMTIFGGEFREEHEVSKLIGSPPGYVGHEEEGAIIKHIRENPEFSVILIDEIEKADPALYEFLLRTMDKGEVTGNKEGQVYNCQNYVIIMTSNIGEMEASTAKAPVGITIDRDTAIREKKEDIVLKAVKGYFSPEFRNRLKGIIRFEHLTEDNAAEILEKDVREMVGRSVGMADGYGARPIITEDAKRQIVKEGFSKEFGARELKRALERRTLECDNLLDILEEGDNAIVDFRDGTFTYEPE